MVTPKTRKLHDYPSLSSILEGNYPLEVLEAYQEEKDKLPQFQNEYELIVFEKEIFQENEDDQDDGRYRTINEKDGLDMDLIVKNIRDYQQSSIETLNKESINDPSTIDFILYWALRGTCLKERPQTYQKRYFYSYRYDSWVDMYKKYGNFEEEDPEKFQFMNFRKAKDFMKYQLTAMYIAYVQNTVFELTTDKFYLKYSLQATSSPSRFPVRYDYDTENRYLIGKRKGQSTSTNNVLVCRIIFNLHVFKDTDEVNEFIEKKNKWKLIKPGDKPIEENQIPKKITEAEVTHVYIVPDNANPQPFLANKTEMKISILNKESNWVPDKFIWPDSIE